MRSIKFRAWHFAEKKMLEVDELNHIASWSFEGMLGVNGINRTIGIQGGKHNDCVVMQSTGLFDKNGKEIYEGDIVSDGVHSYEMIWCEGLYGWMYDDTYSGNLFLPSEISGEIIGNIHENPELIDRYTIHC